MSARRGSRMPSFGRPGSCRRRIACSPAAAGLVRVDPLQPDHMQMHVQTQRRVEPLHKRHGTGPRTRLTETRCCAFAVTRHRPHQDATHHRKCRRISAQTNRTRYSNDNTHCRTGASSEITLSTKNAAVSTMRRVPHDGQSPRPLQEKATTSSCRQSSQKTRAKPCAKIPHRRNASTSRRQNRGTWRSLAASSDWNVAHSDCTMRYKTVLFGSRRCRFPRCATHTQGPGSAPGGELLAAYQHR